MAVSLSNLTIMLYCLEKTDQPTATPGVAVVHSTPGVYIGTAQGQEVR